MNLPDAQNHPDFAYRPETGEEPYASMLAVPVRRAGRTLGVLAVQNRAPRLYDTDEVEALETVAMLLVEPLAAAGASDGAEEGLGATLPRRFAGDGAGGRADHRPGRAGRLRMRRAACWPTTRRPKLARLAHARWRRMRRGIDELITDRLPGDGKASPEAREVLEAYRLVAADPGWLRRVSEAIRGGLSAEAAVHRVAGELRDRMRRIVDPYLRERLADLEDMAGRLLAALDGERRARTGAGRGDPAGAPARARPNCCTGTAAASPAWWWRRPARPATPPSWPARWAFPAIGGARGILEAAETGDEVILDAEDGQRSGPARR